MERQGLPLSSSLEMGITLDGLDPVEGVTSGDLVTLLFEVKPAPAACQVGTVVALKSVVPHPAPRRTVRFMLPP